MIDYLQKKSKVGEILKYFRKNLSKLSIVDELLCYKHHGKVIYVKIRGNRPGHVTGVALLYIFFVLILVEK